MNALPLQIVFILGGIIVLPFAPFLIWQSKRVRKRIGRLPDARGAKRGRAGNGKQVLKLLALGESSVAGVGAKNHGEALVGRLAESLSRKTGRSVHWHALGESGITARETVRRLVPKMPADEMNVVVVALGGNDTFKLSSPQKWRADLSELLGVVRRKNPQAKILVANVPVIRDFPAIPHPLKFVLWRLSRLHHRTAKELIRPLENVYYFDDIKKVGADFFSDGVHPSPQGYASWAEGLINFLYEKQQTK